MRLVTLIYVLAALVVVFVWLNAGRPLAVLIDYVMKIPVVSMQVKSVHDDGGGFVIGEYSMTFGQTNNLRSELCWCTDSKNRVVLKKGRQSFVLGPRTNPVDASRRPDIYLNAEAGDEVILSGARSLIGWPTTFETYIMISNVVVEALRLLSLDVEEAIRRSNGYVMALRAGLFQTGRMDRAADEWNSETGWLDVNIKPPK
jgi:hypothetical protein